MIINKCELLSCSKTIAVVGLSRRSNRVSREIANYLLSHKFEVIGVNPNKSFKKVNEILVYDSLLEIPEKIDIVNVFRKSEDIPSLINDVIEIKPKALWLQLGIRNNAAVKVVSEQGILVVQDSCIKVEHSFCFG